MRTTVCPGALNSGETMLSAFSVVTAKDTSVGGTSRSSKEPDMESFPPMAPIPSSSWALNAPRSAARGLPQRRGSRPGFSKYSWNVRYTSSNFAPEAISLLTDSTTAV